MAPHGDEDRQCFHALGQAPYYEPRQRWRGHVKLARWPEMNETGSSSRPSCFLLGVLFGGLRYGGQGLQPYSPASASGNTVHLRGMLLVILLAAPVTGASRLAVTEYLVRQVRAERRLAGLALAIGFGTWRRQALRGARSKFLVAAAVCSRGGCVPLADQSPACASARMLGRAC